MKHTTSAALLSILLLSSSPLLRAEGEEMVHIMLQGSSADTLTELVTAAGGTVTHDLPIINAVGARLDRNTLQELLQSSEITRHIDDLALPESPGDDEDEDE